MKPFDFVETIGYYQMELYVIKKNTCKHLTVCIQKYI